MKSKNSYRLWMGIMTAVFSITTIIYATFSSETCERTDEKNWYCLSNKPHGEIQLLSSWENVIVDLQYINRVLVSNQTSYTYTIMVEGFDGECNFTSQPVKHPEDFVVNPWFYAVKGADLCGTGYHQRSFGSVRIEMIFFGFFVTNSGVFLVTLIFSLCLQKFTRVDAIQPDPES